jgi:hypothetical protein
VRGIAHKILKDDSEADDRFRKFLHRDLAVGLGFANTNWHLAGCPMSVKTLVDDPVSRGTRLAKKRKPIQLQAYGTDRNVGMATT